MITGELKPMDLGQVFEKAFRLAFANMKKYFKFLLIYLGIVLLISVIFAVIIAVGLIAGGVNFFNMASSNFSGDDFSPLSLIIIIPAGIIGYLMLIVLGVFYYGILYDLMIKGFLNQEWVLKESINQVKGKFFRIIGTAFLMLFVLIAGYLMCCIGVYPMLACIICAMPALMFENTGAAGSISRSFKLIGYSFWPFFGTFLLFILVIGFVQALIQVPFQIVYQFIIAGNYSSLSDSNIKGMIPLLIPLAVFLYIILLAVATILSVVQVSFHVVMFFNQKIKYENFGIETMADALVQEVKEEDKTQS